MIDVVNKQNVQFWSEASICLSRQLSCGLRLCLQSMCRETAFVFAVQRIAFPQTAPKHVKLLNRNEGSKMSDGKILRGNDEHLHFSARPSRCQDWKVSASVLGGYCSKKKIQFDIVQPLCTQSATMIGPYIIVGVQHHEESHDVTGPCFLSCSVWAHCQKNLNQTNGPFVIPACQAASEHRTGMSTTLMLVRAQRAGMLLPILNI